MVPPHSYGIPRVPQYSGFLRRLSVFAYGTIILCGVPSHALLLTLRLSYEVRTLKVLLLLVWPVPRSLATTYGIAFAFTSSPYLDVSVQEVPLMYLSIQYIMTELYSAGLLHSDIYGSLPAYGSP